MEVRESEASGWNGACKRSSDSVVEKLFLAAKPFCATVPHAEAQCVTQIKAEGSSWSLLCLWPLPSPLRRVGCVLRIPRAQEGAVSELRLRASAWQGCGRAPGFSLDSGSALFGSHQGGEFGGEDPPAGEGAGLPERTSALFAPGPLLEGTGELAY